jgi:hypothetical protein
VGVTGANPQLDIGVPTCDLRRDRPRDSNAESIPPPTFGVQK